MTGLAVICPFVSRRDETALDRRWFTAPTAQWQQVVLLQSGVAEGELLNVNDPGAREKCKPLPKRASKQLQIMQPGTIQMIIEEMIESLAWSGAVGPVPFGVIASTLVALN